MSVKVDLKLTRLTKLAARLAPDVIDQGAHDWADAVADKARDFVPVDEGDLKSTIRVEKNDPGVYQVVAGGMSGPNKYVDYAEWVEYGGADDAQPFLTPAWRQTPGLPFFARAMAKLLR